MSETKFLLLLFIIVINYWVRFQEAQAGIELSSYAAKDGFELILPLLSQMLKL